MIGLGKIRNELIKYVVDKIGWHTDKHIIVFESDDWGAIRMSSKESFDKLEELGYEVSKNIYERNDCLESIFDLKNLASVLSKYYDNRGKHPVFTLNYVVANPNFLKIKENKYQEYFYELVTDTYKNYYGKNDIIGFVKECIPNHIFMPQFHSREHLNISRWMEALINDDYGMRKIMNLGCAATHIPELGGNIYVRAYDARTEKEIEFIKKSIREGLELFEHLFGFKSVTAIAPNYLWDVELDKVYSNSGVKCLQGGYKQICSKYNDNRTISHYLGHKVNELYHFIRNCTFECSHFGKNAIDVCWKDIQRAFNRKKPAIICTHRLNYISSINPNNAICNLSYLDELLKKITQTYPDVIFMSSDEMFEYFIHKYNLE